MVVVLVRSMGRGTSVTIVKWKNLFWERKRRKGESVTKGTGAPPAPVFPEPPPPPEPSTPDLGCTAQVVIVHLLDGLEVDDALQLRLMLVCKGNEGRGRGMG